MKHHHWHKRNLRGFDIAIVSGVGIDQSKRNFFSQLEQQEIPRQQEKEEKSKYTENE